MTISKRKLVRNSSLFCQIRTHLTLTKAWRSKRCPKRSSCHKHTLHIIGLNVLAVKLRIHLSWTPRISKRLNLESLPQSMTKITQLKEQLLSNQFRKALKTQRKLKLGWPNQDLQESLPKRSCRSFLTSKLWANVFCKSLTMNVPHFGKRSLKALKTKKHLKRCAIWIMGNCSWITEKILKLRRNSCCADLTLNKRYQTPSSKS